MALISVSSLTSNGLFLTSEVATGKQTNRLQAWDIDQHYRDLKVIEVDQVLEFMTTMEADTAFRSWFNALSVNGKISIKTLDADYLARLWLKADWNESSLKDKDSDARKAFNGLFGFQQGSNPQLPDYDGKYQDVHKSAYNIRRLTFLLERAGFVDVEVREKGQGVIVADARKSMQRGERQIATSYASIRDDHKARYQFACEYLATRDVSSVLDLACGIGYGSLMLANAIGSEVTGVDIDEGAIEYAKNYYSNERTHYICQNAQTLSLNDNSFDAIVSFETIEHVDFDRELITRFYQLLKNGGLFICSTPNEDVMPFDKDKFKFHVRHYRVSEIVDTVKKCGFSIENTFTQKDPQKGEIVQGKDGCFTLLVCRK
jgi:2-polyprenyl-3-methyl-5-hydroxy-6-metoxy-1,4-benzoquinol methylase